MTDFSKIDFTQLKLDNVGAARVHADSVRDERVDLFFGTVSVLYKRENQDWITTSYAAGLNREQVNELFERTEQVDEFIRQQSRRRITVAEMLVEIITSGREMTVLNNGLTDRYRFNAQDGVIEYFAKSGVWVRSSGAGRGDAIVVVLE